MILLNDLKYIIDTQVTRYPKMQPQDVVKLVYQHVFGNGQKVNDKDLSLSFMKKEYETIKYSHMGEDTSGILFAEDIGNWYSRINLIKLEDEEQLISLNDAYVASSGFSEGNLEYFISRLYFLNELASYGTFEFDEEEMQTYLKSYEKQNYPMVNHSERYKEFYDPAYRVIDARYIRLLPLITRIRKLMNEKKKVVIAIDGRTSSGKSTAAELLSLIFDASVIHMDDFMLPMELRTRERLDEPGGNVHYERFKDEVVRFIKKDDNFSYRRYDGMLMNYGQRVDIEAKPLMIVEGTYSQHIEYRTIYDLQVFFDIDAPMQKQQIYNRDGEEVLQLYESTLIPLEEKYFEHSEIQNKSDIVISF